MRKNKHIIAVSIAFVLIIAQTVSAFAITSKGACAMDAYTEEVLYEYNADEPLAPASMTKVMTAYIIYDYMEQGKFNKATEVICSEYAARASRDSDATNVPLVAGEKYTIDELIGAIMIPSACAACTLVGEYIAGSETQFADLMNQYVYKLGLEAYYEDASGLSDNNRISARSMAKLGARFIREFPDILTYTSMPSFTFRGKVYENTNLLLAGNTYEYEGADGLKTGTTTLAGRCLTATALRDGTRIVGVTMRSTSTKSRYTDIISILDEGFNVIEQRPKEKIFADNINIYIGDAKIPAFCHDGITPETVIFAEHLENYGFDIYYDAENRTVNIIRDKQKQINPVATEPFANFNTYAKNSSDLRVILNDDGYIYEFDKVYDLSGYAAIRINEVAKMYRYIGNNKSGHFQM